MYGDSSSRFEDINRLRNLVPIVINILELDHLNTDVADFFVTVLDRFPAFLQKDNFEALAQKLASSQARQLVHELKIGLDGQLHGDFRQLLVTYAQSAVTNIAAANDSCNREIGQLMYELLQCQGYPGVDDSTSAFALRFWEDYTVVVQEADSKGSAGQEKPPWLEPARQRLWIVIDAIMSKICWPPDDAISHWDSEQLEDFRTFRNDARELFEITYTILYSDLFNHFARHALVSHANSQWPAVEASIFVLNALSEHFFAEDNHHDAALNELFSSDLFGVLVLEPSHLSSRIQHGRLDLLRQCAGFFTAQPVFLPGLLNTLFAYLKDQHLAVQASMTIHSIGSSCAEQLLPEVGRFLEHYKSLSLGHPIDTEVKTNVIAAAAGIVSKMPADEAQKAALRFLLECTLSDFRLGMRVSAQNPSEGRSTIVCALKCLVAMGKQLQTTGDEESADGEFWNSGGGGQALQNTIMDIVALSTRVLYQDREVIEAACQVLRAGYKETRPGLFVFPAVATDEFVRSVTIHTGKQQQAPFTPLATLQDENIPEANLAYINHEHHCNFANLS